MISINNFFYNNINQIYYFGNTSKRHSIEFNYLNKIHYCTSINIKKLMNNPINTFMKKLFLFNLKSILWSNKLSIKWKLKENVNINIFAILFFKLYEIKVIYIYYYDCIFIMKLNFKYVLVDIFFIYTKNVSIKKLNFNYTKKTNEHYYLSFYQIQLNNKNDDKIYAIEKYGLCMNNKSIVEYRKYLYSVYCL